MEIFIFGVILVVLMVFTSTKIKKSAASAFEQEVVENAEFRLVKPEGFISPINQNSDIAFEAYTKDFGKNDADEFRQSSANLTADSDLNFKTAIENIKKSGEKILSKKFLETAPERQKICLLESEKIEKDVGMRFFYKIIENIQLQKVYRLKVSVLDAYLEEYRDRINEMLESFVLK